MGNFLAPTTKTNSKTITADCENSQPNENHPSVHIYYYPSLNNKLWHRKKNQRKFSRTNPTLYLNNKLCGKNQQ